MTEDSARSILKLIAVAVIMVGLSMFVRTVMSLLAAGSSMPEISTDIQFQVSGTIAQLGLFSVLADLGVAALGLALFVLSPKLAEKIVESSSR